MKGKIYIIRSHQTEDVYYGCTTQKYLSSRFASHKRDFKNKPYYCTSFKIIQYEDCYIELVEEVEYENKDHLKAREGFYIRNNKCVNKYIPDRTDEEWREDNRDIKNEKGRKYWEINKDKINEKRKKIKSLGIL